MKRRQKTQAELEDLVLRVVDAILKAGAPLPRPAIMNFRRRVGQTPNWELDCGDLANPRYRDAFDRAVEAIGTDYDVLSNGA